MKKRPFHYSEEFRKQFIKLPARIQRKAIKLEGLFRDNPLHPSLRLHKLKGKPEGLWSISIDRKYRIIFKAMDDGVILLVSIGLHAIYE